MGMDVILHQAGEQGLGHAEPDRAGGEIHHLAILGAGRIGLRALVAAEIHQLLAALAAQKILDGVKGGTGMRLDRDPVLRLQHREIERGQDGGERGGGGLVPAHLQAVVIVAQVIGVVDGPARQPQDFLFQLGQNGQTGIGHGNLRGCWSRWRNPSIRWCGGDAEYHRTQDAHARPLFDPVPVAVVLAAPVFAADAPAADPAREFVECVGCPQMVAIPAGKFLMGSPASEPGRFDSEGPQHVVQVKAFALGKYDITSKQFLAFLAATGYQPKPCNKTLNLGWQSIGTGPGLSAVGE